jgi:arylsulfatase A-like enzyme
MSKAAKKAAAVSRRSFLQTTAMGMGAAAPGPKPPNVLYILCDQLNGDALSAYGNPDIYTPNLDRLVKRGVSFMESHSANPICCQARACLMTGRMPVETGVVQNGRSLPHGAPIHSSVPNLGQWFGERGYETVYCGKWHLMDEYPAQAIPGFAVLPAGNGEGCVTDPFVSRACQAYLRHRSRKKPFFLVASFMQPHDVTLFWMLNKDLVPKELPFPALRDKLPPLPPNNRVRPAEPQRLVQWLRNVTGPPFSDEQWRFYIYCYYRQAEMMDAELGRILNALEASGEARNTVVVFTGDHGEGAGRHGLVQKWSPYDEALKVPLIVSAPGGMEEGLRDTRHLVSAIDIAPTLCDYAGIPAPPHACGSSLRPLLEQKPTVWREFITAELQVVGRLLRTQQYKYVRYPGDPVEQLFDLKADPWEVKNVFDDPKYVGVIKEHRKLLQEWESHLIPA